MWCLVSLPNSLVLEVELDAKALGQDCLNKVCQHMGIVETDFFGLLQVQPGPKGESPYWLNLRNGLLRQLSGSPPYRLQMKVKFFVKPHYMLHPSTRKVVLESLMSHVIDESLKCSEEELVTFLGLVAQAELGDFKQAMLPAFKESYSQYLPESKCEGEDLTVKICVEHKKHRGMKTDSAVYRALQSAVEWPGYGVEWHSVRKAQTAEPLSVGVGPEAIVLTDQQNGDKRSIEYGSVQKATHAGKCFYLHTFAEDGSTVTETFKLATQKASNALYRCVTEMYLFYYCDTVRNDVASQFDRDIKAALASLFSENKEVGKKYVFDIQQTLQETYDHNRRRLFNEENMPPAEPSEEYHSETEDDESSSDGETSNSSDEYADEVCTKSSHVKPVKNAGMYSDWLLCKVCMDCSINTVFCPCGHVVCCHDCASKLQDCPLCRQVVSNVQLIYLPSVSDTKLAGVCES